MKRLDLYIPEDHLLYLRHFSKTGLTVSEHIRVAISDYIEKKVKANRKASVSPSVKGATNG